jgi:methanethiol S-methyltransferase
MQMEPHDAPAYGLWPLVVINSLVFLIFAFSFTKPSSARDWRSFGAFAAFVVALFTEMYGFPLTLYLLSGWLQTRYPELDLLSHDSGHLWQTLFGWKGDPHFDPLHLASIVLIIAGFTILARAWRVLYEAQRAGRLAKTGPYARVRHPQYAGFVLILLGFLLQWPTILTLAMFPVLIVMYAYLARTEEAEMVARFGDAYRRYAMITPRFVPRRGARAAVT